MTPYSDPQPVRLPVLQAVWRNLWIATIPVLVLVGIAVAVGLKRSPTYTAEARLNVGGVSLTTQSIPGYTVAVEELATAYSRAVGAPAVIRPIAQRLGLTFDQAVNDVSATPIQGSPVIRVDATSAQPKQAIRLANATADGLVKYAQSLNSGAVPSDQLLRRYVASSRRLQKALGAQGRVKKFKGPRGLRRRHSAQTKVDVARLQLQTTGSLYQASQAGQATTDLVEKLAPAANTTSDRMTVLQDLVAGALIAGVLIGIGLAVARANRLSRRRLGGP